MRLAIASDHAGFDYKERIKLYLIETGHHVHDFGTHSDASCDYPVLIRPAAEAVASGEYDRGIVLGGSGNGEAIVANRVPGIRCALCWNVETARLGREHNNANMISIGQRMVDFDEAMEIVQTWLETPFSAGRHLRRIRQIDRHLEANDAVDFSQESPFQQRTQFVDEGRYICDSCREDFHFPVDISEGRTQELVEKCPVCWHENVIYVSVDSNGQVIVSGDQHTTG
ncbi:MAG TPA: ribose 5-phosphate isomerase B [Planctomicrobium sp.]|nr:ribose 5-phosphate isomerase B [Planctomicrobium sp.]